MALQKDVILVCAQMLGVLEMQITRAEAPGALQPNPVMNP